MPQLNDALQPLIESPDDPAVARTTAAAFATALIKTHVLDSVTAEIIEAVPAGATFARMSDKLPNYLRDPVAVEAAKFAVLVGDAWSRKALELYQEEQLVITPAPSGAEALNGSEAELAPWITAPTYLSALLRAVELEVGEPTLQSLAFSAFDEAASLRSRLARAGISLQLYSAQDAQHRSQRLAYHLRLLDDAVSEDELTEITNNVVGG